VSLLSYLDSFAAFLRPTLLALAVALALVATLDWMVRTRRLNPFGGVARLFRRWVDPWVMPIERVVVRSGGLPAHAPWWAAGFVVFSGILLLAAVDFLRGQLAFALAAVDGGARGVYRLAITWVFAVLQLALIVRVVLSWIRARPGAWYARWSYKLSEPFLKPIRNAVPMIGMVDVSPIVAWFLLGIVQAVLIRVW